jgi:hypothetical protein
MHSFKESTMLMIFLIMTANKKILMLFSKNYLMSSNKTNLIRSHKWNNLAFEEDKGQGFEGKLANPTPRDITSNNCWNQTNKECPPGVETMVTIDKISSK